MGRVRVGHCPEDAIGAIRRELSEGLWYLATVYTSHPEGLEVAYRQANEAAARVIRVFGARIFCPIAHSHSLCRVYGTKHGLHGETDSEFWKWFDEPFLARVDGLIVVMMPNWRISLGVTHEIEETAAAGKPILYLSWPDLAVMRMTRGGDSAYDLRYPESELSARAVGL